MQTCHVVKIVGAYRSSYTWDFLVYVVPLPPTASVHSGTHAASDHAFAHQLIVCRLSFSDLPEIGSMLAAAGPSGDLAARMESQGIGLGGGMHDSAVLVANTAAAFYSGHLDPPGGRAGTPMHAYVAGSGELECASGGG